jgi:hypothetical protein
MMRIVKYFVTLGLSIVMGACYVAGTLNIDIGDYEGELAAWNSQNMLDYRLDVDIEAYASGWDWGVIKVKNGVAVNSEPPSWLEDGNMSTIPEFFSFIKSEEQSLMDRHKKSTDTYTLEVRYNTEYHYPERIYYGVSHASLSPGNWSATMWRITLTPLGEE